MKTIRHLTLSLLLAATSIHAESVDASMPAASAEQPAQSIPFSELGAKATADYKGDAIGITATAEGANLRTGFQKLAGTVTSEGLRLESTEAEGGSLQLTASAVGRVLQASQPARATPENASPQARVLQAFQPARATPESVPPQAGLQTEPGYARAGWKARNTLLPAHGSVANTDTLVTFTRPGLVEEYSVSADGVRQDFIIDQRPAGTGQLSIELALSGATAEAAADGAKLILGGSGRALAYNRLHVTDAQGKSLAATLAVLSPTRLAVQVDDAGAVYPIRVDPTFSDADWVSLNPGPPGVNSHVSALAVSGSELYIGGSFHKAGGVSVNYIAKWNGTAWSSLGSGMDSFVNALAIIGGDLYAGGTFATAGGISANGIAKWNGSVWSALGSGMDLGVYALVVSGSDLYAAGGFTTAGGISANHIAKWNGSAWSALGSGINGYVYDLAVSGGDLYAGGNFTTAGGISANHIAKWNGSTWSALGTGMNGEVSALAVSGSDIYAGGDFTTAGGISANNIAKWNGSTWSALGSGMNYWVNALAVSGSDLYVGGVFTTAGGISANRIAKWNGSTWSALGSGVDNWVYALAVVGDDLYVGGDIMTVDSATVYNIAKWNGSTWSALGSGMGGNGNSTNVSALAVSGSDLYVGGGFTTVGGISANYIAKWNGSTWSALGSGMGGGGGGPSVYALAVIGSDLYAAGGFTTAGGTAANYIAKWNGSAWSALGSGMNNFVVALAVIGSDLYVGGGFTTAGGISTNSIAKWDGSAWSALGSGMNSDSYVSALAVSGSDLYAGGDFTTAGGISANHIAKWNGSSWSALGSGMDLGVYALAASGSDLYAGGDFTTAGGISAISIAKWNGSAWSALGSGMNSDSYVDALAVIGSNLYAGGVFTTAGGTAANNIAKWNGTEWSALGSGVDGSVSALAAGGATQLYVGGAFDFAGTALSPYLAQANLPATVPTDPIVIGISPNTGPTFGGTGVTLTGSNFTGATGVAFGGNAAASFTVDSATQITCITPAGSAGSASVLVTTAGGTNAANTLFTYVAPPTITASAANLLRDSTSLTLFGTGFDALTPNANSVVFTPAGSGTVTTATATSLTVTGLSGLSLGALSAVVTTHGLSSGAAVQVATVVAPEIAVTGNSVPILNGDSTPSIGDFTDLGTVPQLNQQVTRRITIHNMGTAPLNLTATPRVQITGSEAGDFKVTALPASPVVAGGSTSFDLTFDPTLPGLRRATINIPSDDPANPVFTFAIRGFGGLSTLLTQTITFVPPATVYLNQSPLTLTATSSSGLPVTLSLVAPIPAGAALTGNMLTFATAGTVKVKAEQLGSGNYKAATAVTKSITVKANPTVLTLLNLTQIYDGTAKPISSIPVADSITYKVGGVDVSTAPTAAGSYAVKAVAGTVTKTGTLVIAKRMLTVTPDDKRKFAGQANPTLTSTITGFIGGDTDSLITKPIVLTTTATLASAGGQYPIKASGGAAANYAFNFQQGTLVVESFAGSYEALLVEATPLPVGKLTLLVAATSKTFTGKLYTATETSALALSGPLTTDSINELATGNASVTTKSGIVYAVSFTLPLQGDVLATATRDALALGSANDGRKLSTQPVLYAGAHTAVMKQVLPAASGIPTGAGWATAAISTAGVITLAGELGDGTKLTSTLSPDGDSNPGYRLWVQPYLAARTQSYFAGAFTLLPHPTLANRRYLDAANLTWKKAGLPADASYRAGFGPVTTVLTIDPWLPPVAATKTTPAITLAKRLGMTGTVIEVAHSDSHSDSDINLPTSINLSDSNVVSVLAPVTSPVNVTKWKTILSTKTGTFTGSYELTDSGLKRPVMFSGILRQPAEDIDSVIGDGHFVLPPQTGTEKLTGEVLFQRP